MLGLPVKIFRKKRELENSSFLLKNGILKIGRGKRHEFRKNI